MLIDHQLPLQFLSGLLIGLGVGGVVGASTLGVAMFTLIAPAGQLREFTAVIPVVNCIVNIGTVSVYFRKANWKTVFRMWPAIMVGIGAGTYLLPIFAEGTLRRMTAVVYALVLVQQLADKFLTKEKPKSDGPPPDRTKFYESLPVTIVVSLLCGILTVVCNNSGPIFNVYLLSLGLDMNQFVATRSVIMAGKNVAKVVARVYAGGLSVPVIIHGAKLGATGIVGIFLAKSPL